MQSMVKAPAASKRSSMENSDYRVKNGAILRRLAPGATFGCMTASGTLIPIKHKPSMPDKSAGAARKDARHEPHEAAVPGAARERVLHGANRLAETNRNTHGSECTASAIVVKKCMQTGQATNQPYSLFSAAATIALESSTVRRRLTSSGEYGTAERCR